MTSRAALLLTLTLVGLTLPQAAAPAPAAALPSARLGEIASTVAKRPLRVSCETSWSAWNTELGLRGSSILISRGELYVNPGTCRTLHLALRNSAGAVSSYGLVRELLVVASGAKQANGLKPPQRANCAALALLPRLLARFFPGTRDVRASIDRLYARNPGRFVPAC